MAPKLKSVLIRLISTAETGFWYIYKKPTKFMDRKYAFMKYDPVVNRHVLFTESKLPSPKKRVKNNIFTSL
jgi:large subunit ribosomal protein L33